MRIILLEASPIDPATNLPVVVRLCSVNTPRTVIVDGQLFTPAITSGSNRQISVTSAGLQTGHSPISISVSGNEAWANLVWDGCIGRMWVGQSTATAIGSFTRIYEGVFGSITRDGPICEIALKGQESRLDRDLLNATYAGTGNAEGPSEMLGTLKPWCSGQALNIEPVLVDSVRWIYQFHGYGAAQAVDAVYENALTLGAPSATFTTWNALRDATLAAGQWAAAPAIGAFRLGAEPTGKITADVRGALNGASPALTMNLIVRHLLARAGLDTQFIHAASIDAFNQPWNFYATDPIRIGDICREAFYQAGGYFFSDEAGVFKAGTYISTKTPQVLTTGELRSDPIVLQVTQDAAPPPVWRVKVGFNRCWSTHTTNEISAAVSEFASDLTAVTTAAQNAVDTANAANSSATLANNRLASMANDNVLDRADKFAIIREYQDIIAEQSGIDARAVGFSITTERTAYNSAVTTLTSYLTGLSPAWNDTTTDTTIVSATFRQRFADVYLARQALLNRFSEIAAQRATVAGAEAGLVNSNIGVVGGAITGIGTGNGTPVANGSITVDGSGVLSGIGTANINVDNRGVVPSGTLAARPATGSFVGQTYLVTSGASLGLLSRWSGSAWVDGPTRNTGALADLNAVDLAGGSVTGTLPIARADNGLRNNAITVDGSGILSGIGTANIAVDNSRVPFGTNMLVNTEFTRGKFAWNAGNGTAASDWGVNLPSYFGHRNVMWIRANGILASGAVRDVSPAALWEGMGLADAPRFALPVQQGDRVYASVLAARHRCNFQLYLLTFNSAGTMIDAPVVSGGFPVGGINGDPANFERLSIVREMQPNARWAIPMMRLLGAGAFDPYIFFTEPAIGKVGSGQTAIPAYVQGRGDPNAEVSISISGPNSASFTYTSTGDLDPAAQMPATLVYRLNTTSGAITSGVTWQYRIIEGTVNSTNASPTLLNMTQSAGGGQLSISNLLTNSAQIEIVGSILGVSCSQFLTLNKVFAAPPTGGGGGGPASASQTSGFTSVTSSSFASVSSELQVTSTTTTQTVNVQLTFVPPNNSGSTSTVEVQLERWNGSAWVAMGAAVSVNTETYFDTELNRWLRNSGAVNFSRTATITVGSNQRTRVRARLSSGAASHTVNGTLTLNA